MILPDLDSQMIDQIVRNVLQRIELGETRTVNASPANHEQPSGLSEEVTIFSDPVLTEKLLKSRIQQSGRIEISQNTILTPSAKDYLRLERIEWTRSSSSTPQSSANGLSQWCLLILNDAPRLNSIAKDLKDCNTELVGSNTEAVSLAVSKICRASACGVIVCCENSFEVACRANRNFKVRAVTVDNIKDIEASRRQIDANVYCINSVSMPFYVIRNLLKGIIPTKPALTHNWSD